MSFLRKMFNSGVEKSDPRRFVVEAMLGAVEADGDVTQEELDVLDRNLSEHELFRDLSGEARARLIDMAAEAIREAGSGKDRVKSMAKGLASRGHRFAAYAMACEICVSDNDLPEAEIRYLEALQKGLGIDDDEAKDIFEGARSESGLQTVEEKAEQMRQIMPQFVDCMAMMAAADGEVHDDELTGVRAVLRQIPDMAVLTPEELDKQITKSLARIKGKDIDEELVSVSKSISNLADRYWTAVYMMIVALADGKTDWREVAFLRHTKETFELSDDHMNYAMETASAFPAVDLGGVAPE